MHRNSFISKLFLHTKPFYIDNVKYETLKDAAIVHNVDVTTIKNRIKNRKEYLRLLKDRDRKIKLGIIKINKEDPYGEEDWI